MRLFENKTFKTTYTLVKVKDKIIMLPKIIDFGNSNDIEWKKTLKADLKIEYAIDNSLADLDNVYQIFNESPVISNEEIEEMLMDTICSYSNCLVCGCTDAGINIMNILFPIYYGKSELNKILKIQNLDLLKGEYEDTISILLAFGHYSGAYFEALHLMCSGSEQDRSRGDELMFWLVSNNNPFAKKRDRLLEKIKD